MKTQGIISAALLTAGIALSIPTYACSTSIDDGGSFDGGSVLRSHPRANKNLDCGEFEFGNVNSRYGSSFVDFWKFTVADDTTASISVFDMELGFDSSSMPLQLPGKSSHHRSSKSLKHFDTSKIFDTTYLSFSLFDGHGNLLGSAGENQTLTGLMLEAGERYTIKVSGQVAGLFGSAYHGVLETCVAPVPLGDSAPLLGSALALLAVSYRKRLTKAA